MNLGLQDKRALVTGGTHGIGKSIALKLQEEGCRVLVFSRSVENVTNMKKLGIEAMIADATKARDVNKITRYEVDILINNVGGGSNWGTDIEKTSEDTWKKVWEKNCLTSIRFTKRVMPYMKKNKWGRIVTISSIYGREAGGKSWFSISKVGQISFMKSLAIDKELTRSNITFNSVAPGPLYIKGTSWAKMRHCNSKAYEDYIEKLPLGRLGTPDEVANVVVFLCSEKASLVNGACIAIDGGQGSAF